MSDFKQLLKEMEEKREVVNREIPDDYRTAGTILGQKRRAEQDLLDLKEEFNKTLRSNSLFILPEGSDEEQMAFAEQANKLGCYLYDVDDFIESLVRDINPAIYKNQDLNATVLSQVTYELELLAGIAGINAFNQLVINGSVPEIKDKESLKKSITSLFQDQVGCEFMGVVAVNQLTDTAILTSFAGKVFPIVLTRTNKFNNSTLKDISKTNGSVFNFKLDPKLTDTYVKNVLKEAKKASGR